MALRNTSSLFKTWQKKVRTVSVMNKGKTGGPARRRLWAGVVKVCPIMAYSTQHVPFGQFVVKKGHVNTSTERVVVDPQRYSHLKWTSEDDTPALIHRNSQDLQGYGKEGGDYWDGYHFTNGRFMEPIEDRPVQVISLNAKDLGKVVYPAVPEEDSRMLSNAEWRHFANQDKVRKYLQKHLMFSIFPNMSSNVNMNVAYGSDSLRHYWRSVYTGNVIEVKHTMQQPRVMIPDDSLDDDAYYTLVMASPDYPFRAEPEDGHLLHWVVSNIKPQGGRVDVAAAGDTVVPYLMPLPSEDAGLLRYVFALYKQNGKISVSEASASLSDRRRFQLHGTAGKAIDSIMKPVHAAVGPDPEAVTFFHTSFDYEVADWYKANDEPEPMWTPTDILENTANFVRKERYLAGLQPWAGPMHQKGVANWGRSQFNYM
eukprot:TRINITY_DN9108_c0_g1_i1.p1 TRINITY_DN9108_c0_g1~~TRINITY_DN9108_c0_g1_i1.p1  ORF type:complete len:439 (+),score=128.06 TRINITY_DN9108_c0_g1_i1:42-1319(+)